MHTVETIPPTVSYCVKNITVGEVTAAADRLLVMHTAAFDFATSNMSSLAIWR